MTRSPRSSRAGRPARRRFALAPGLLGVVVALGGIIAIGTEAFFFVQFVIAILALIVGWFALQARQWWWLPIPVALAVVWNPVVPIPLDDAAWLTAQYLAVLGFVVAGLVITVPEDEAR